MEMLVPLEILLFQKVEKFLAVCSTFLFTHPEVSQFAPEKLYTFPKGKLSSNHHFSGTILNFAGVVHMGVSKNRGTPKWMIYNGKPY